MNSVRICCSCRSLTNHAIVGNLRLAYVKVGIAQLQVGLRDRITDDIGSETLLRRYAPSVVDAGFIFVQRVEVVESEPEQPRTQPQKVMDDHAQDR